MKQKIQFLIVSMLFLLATPAALTAYGQPMLTFTAQNGTITAKAGSTVITSGATVAQGTTLTFTLTPNQEYTLSSLTTQQFIFGEDFQVNNRSVGIDTGTDVTANATYSASTGTYTYTCTMPANNFDVRAVFTPKPIDFTDPAVEALCLANWDTNHDGVLTMVEAAAVTDLGEVFKGNTEITSFDELQYFTGLTEIGDNSFDFCTALTSVIIPSTVTTIGVDAFSHCPMTTVTIPESVEIIRNWAFSDCGVLTSVTIPESVTSLGQGAFSCCYGLTSVNIPNSITSISEHAFAHCSALTSVEIPNSVTSIGQYAFQYCSNLTDLVIPSSVSSIGWGAFEQTPQLASIVVDDANTTFDSRDNCNAIIETATNTLVAACKNTVIPNTITAIGGAAFTGCTGLNSVIIPENVTSIEYWAFNECSGLTSLTIPKSVTSIGESSFNGCTNLTEIHWTPNADTDLSSSLASANLTSTDRTLYLYKNADNAAMVDYVVSGYDGQFEEIIVVSESITIEVLASGVTLSQSAITFTTAGETATLTATVAPADVTDGSVTWTSSNENVATVSSEGVVTAVANGTATITATTNDGTNITASCAITVNISEPDTDISQIDNVVYMESTEVSAGSEETLSIKMKNTDGIQTLQFDLYLPDGVEVLTDEDDFELIELSTERTTARKMDQFSVQRMSNGAYRVLINSSRGYTFDGTDGEIATVQVGISETMTPGNYPVVFRDIVLVNTSSVGYETVYVKCSLNIPDYKPGDVNNDTKVNAIDLNAITNYILERRDFPFTFNKKAANINGDKETNGDEKINAIDLNAVTNMILNEGATTSSANRRRGILIPD